MSSHRLPTQRLWVLAGIALYVVVSMSQITRPDYNTDRRAPPSEWLWVVVPAGVVVALIAWRAWRSRVDAGPDGITIIRITSTEHVRWESLSGFEVKRTPNGWGWRAVARHVDGRVSKLGGVPFRGDRARARVERFVDSLSSARDGSSGRTGG